MPATEDAPRRVFVYGTLLDPAVLAARAGRRGLARRASPAALQGWRRVRLRGTPWPTLRRQRGAVVRGLVIGLRGAALRRLMAYEGPAYRLHPVRVLTPRGPCRAAAWVTAAWLANHGPDWA